MIRVHEVPIRKGRGVKALVNGGVAFIASHVVYLLMEQGHEITVIDNYSVGRLENVAHLAREITVIEADLARPGAPTLCPLSSDKVVHALRRSGPAVAVNTAEYARLDRADHVCLDSFIFTGAIPPIRDGTKGTA